MDLNEKLISRETIYRGKVFNVHRDKITLPDGKDGVRELVEHHGGVGVLPLAADGTVYLVRQFRYGAGEVYLEIPAGKLEKGESPRECGLRELQEEVGFSAARVVSLGEFSPTPAYDTEITWLYLAADLTPVPAKLDEDEFLEIVQMPLEEAVKMAADGSMRDAKTIIALLRVWQRRDEYVKNCSDN